MRVRLRVCKGHSVLDFLVVTTQNNIMCKTNVRVTPKKNYFCTLKQAESVAFESNLIALFTFFLSEVNLPSS